MRYGVAFGIYAKEWFRSREADKEPASVAEPEAKTIGGVDVGLWTIIDLAGP